MGEGKIWHIYKAHNILGVLTVKIGNVLECSVLAYTSKEITSYVNVSRFLPVQVRGVFHKFVI